MKNSSAREKNDLERNRAKNTEKKNGAQENIVMESERQTAAAKDKKETGKMTPRRIAALLGVILLAALYLITLIAAIVDKSSSGKWFLLCLIGTVTIPLLIWIYTWMYGVLTNRRTIATLELEQHDESKPAEQEAGGGEKANTP